jgi:drug/metabolite transporter (DMT)-like permease
LLFGAAAPAKLLLVKIDPWLLAALLYLGSGLGLAVLRRLRGQPQVRLAPGEGRWFAGAVLAGGVAGPVLLMAGLAGLPASQTSLLLNAEAVFTALLAWFVFRENVDRRVALGMAAIVAGGVVLAWPGGAARAVSTLFPTLLVLAACLAWAVDNNLTRKVSLVDASWIAMVKGLVAGSSNLLLALALGATWPAASLVLDAMLLGFFSYGISLVLFVRGLRALGTARTGAYFSVAPFFGALLSVLLLGDAVTWPLLAAARCGCRRLAALSDATAPHAHEAMDHAHERARSGATSTDHVHVPPVRPAPPQPSHQHGPWCMRIHTTDAHHRHGHSVGHRGGNAMPRRCGRAQSLWVIRDDAVDAPADQLVHQRRIVHGQAGPAGPARAPLRRAPA